ncbi:MAG: outer membrane lipoprotein-sorting protein [Bacteriovoracaceae bacterium]|nr:outer membrane lipoprotein-sorting protein [Bacteriovoracaceae bacterium]
MITKLMTLLYLALGLTFVGGLIEVKNIKTQYSLDQFFPKKHELLENHERLQKKYRLHESSPYIYVITAQEEDYWLNPQNIKNLKKLTENLQYQDQVSKVITMTSIEGASLEGEDLIIGSAFDRILPGSWKREIPENQLIYPMLISNDFKSTLVIVEHEKESVAKREFENRIQKTLIDHFPQQKILFGGIPVIQNTLTKMIQDELTLFLSLTGIIFCFLFYAVFSHWSAVVSAIVTLVYTNIITLALLSLFKIPMNAILITTPVIISVSMISLIIHTFHLWANNRLKRDTFEMKVQKSLLTIKEVLLPNILGVTTTAVGFMALSPSPIPLLKQYGYTVTLLLLFISILSQVLLFSLLPLVNPRMRSWLSRPARWSLAILKHSNKTIILSTLLVSLGLYSLNHLNFSNRLFDDLPQENPIRKSNEWIDKTFGGLVSFDISVHSNKEGYWKKHNSIERLNQVSEEIRNHHHVGSVINVADFFQGFIPKSDASIAETFFLFSMAEKNPLLAFLSEDGKDTRVAIKFNDLPTKSLDQTKIWILSKLKAEFPELSFTVGGLASYGHEINQGVASQLVYDFWKPLVLIGLFLVLIFKSIRLAFTACLPNLIPPFVLILMMSLNQTPIKPGLALVFSIALGFAFNNTLYILARLKKFTDLNDPEALKHALLAEGNPCLTESLFMFFGFSIFLFSDFDMNQKFGGFMLASVVSGFLADLLLLPSILKTFPSLYQSTSLNIKFEKWRYFSATLILVLFAGVAFADEASEILKQSRKNLDALDDQAKIEMTIVEKNGETKERQLSLQTIRKEGFSVIARILSPADIKDMSFLGNVDEEGNETQYIYMPSSGQIRRLVTGKTKAGLLGSEISPEDLNSQAIKGASVKKLKGDAQFHWIELTPENGTSDYTHVVTKIGKKDLLPHSTHYYIGKKMKKTVSFDQYKKVGSIWRAQKMSVKNHLNGRGTIVLLSDIKVNSGLSADDFTQSALKDN